MGFETTRPRWATPHGGGLGRQRHSAFGSHRPSSIASLPSGSLVFFFALHSLTSSFLLIFFASSSSSIRLPLRHVIETTFRRTTPSPSSLDRGRRQVGDTFDVLDVEDPSSASLNLPSASAPGVFSLRGKPGLGYYVAMSFGTPPQTLNVLVDTGSSNLAVACAPDPCVDKFFSLENSSSWEPTGVRVMVPYTQGKWEGNLVTELVGVATVDPDAGAVNESFDSDEGDDGVVRIRANLACIESSKNFFINGSKWHGILGLGYPVIARPSPDVKPFLDSLTEVRALSGDLFALKLCGTLDTRDRVDVSMGGSLDLGEVDGEAFSGPIYYTRLRREWYYDVVMTDVDVEGTSVGVEDSCREFNVDKTIVDSGTTNLRLPTKVFRRLVTLIKRATKLHHPPVPDEVWQGKEIMCWKKGSTPWERFPEIGLWLSHDPTPFESPLTTSAPNTSSTTASHSFSSSSSSQFRLVISPQQYLRAIESQGIGNHAHSNKSSSSTGGGGASSGKSSSSSSSSGAEDCFKFSVTPSSTGSVIGAVVMEGFYTVFDRANERIGFALSTCPLRDPTRVKGPRIEGPLPFVRPPKVTTTAFGASKRTTPRHSGTHLATVAASSSTSSSSSSSSSSSASSSATSPTADGFVECAYTKSESWSRALMRYAVYSISGICAVVVVLLVAIVAVQYRKSERTRKAREEEKERRRRGRRTTKKRSGLGVGGVEDAASEAGNATTNDSTEAKIETTTTSSDRIVAEESLSAEEEDDGEAARERTTDDFHPAEPSTPSSSSSSPLPTTTTLPLSHSNRGAGVMTRSASLFGGAIWRQARETTNSTDDQRVLVDHEAATTAEDL